MPSSLARPRAPAHLPARDANLPHHPRPPAPRSGLVHPATTDNDRELRSRSCLSSNVRQRMNTHPEITLSEDGFALCGSDKEVFVSFADVCAIRAEKIDLFSFDEIRVTFERRKKEPVEISEESLGCDELMARVISRFSGSDAQWFSKVAHPAFAPCPTTIWKEEPNSEGSAAPQRAAGPRLNKPRLR
jgi:hypothetical protein